MDKLDYLVLSELLKEGTLSFVDIAKKINSTSYTVRRRYEKMKKDGLIFKCSASINLAKLGYQGKAFLLITVTPNANKSETMEYIKTIRNVMVVTKIIGPYDILAIAPVTDVNSVKVLVSETKKAPYLQRVELACIDDVSFPIGTNFEAILSQKSLSLANIEK